MNFNWILVLSLVVCAGCGRPSNDGGADPAPGNSASAAQSSTSGEPQPPTARITNRFGMTFCLVTVDAARPEHGDTYPSQSYYLQQTELTVSQFKNYSEQKVEKWEDRIEMQFPTQWSDVADLAKGLSAADPDFDYRLPTHAQWVFACKNGYDQTCAKLVAGSTPDSSNALRRNKYGIEGFVNHDIECGNVPGQFFGQLHWYDWMYSAREVPECSCDHVTNGNPRSDDSLDELITGRFILIPASPSEGNGGKQ